MRRYAESKSKSGNESSAAWLDRLRQSARRAPREHRQSIQDAVAVLEKRRAHTLDDMLRILSEPNSTRKERIIVCWLAGQLRDKRVVPVLIQVFETASQSAVIWEAAKAVSTYQDRRVGQVLLKHLRRRNDTARRVAAAYALGFVSEPFGSGGEELRRVLRSRTAGSKLRDAAAQSLGLLRFKAAVPELDRALRDRSPIVRESAAYALAEIAKG